MHATTRLHLIPRKRSLRGLAEGLSGVRAMYSQQLAAIKFTC